MNTSKITPIFLFSLPRSGSTLMQRILASHEGIATLAEPWILLPLLYARKEHGIYTEYRQGTAARAIHDFCVEMPHKEMDYQLALRDFVMRLYAKVTPAPARYFLDKTPRYHLITNEILNLFPEGKFIFLWRNPLAVIASIIESFAQGKWNLYRYQVDLFEGLPNLVQAYSTHRTQSCAVRYEDLLMDSMGICKQVFSYLDLSFDERLLSDFTKIQFNGRLGDATGIHEYHSLSQEPLNKWMRTLNNPLRKAWCRRYLQWIGPECLRVMGYDLDHLLQRLRSTPLSMQYMVSDLFYMGFGLFYRAIEFRILKHKLSKFPDFTRVYAHT